MKIRSLETEGVEGVADGVHAFGKEREPASLVVIEGPPRSGRTSFLRGLIAAKESIGGYAGGMARALRPTAERPRVRARLRCLDEDAELDLDRHLEATVERELDLPYLPAHDDRLVDLLRRFDVGSPTPKLWLFDESTGWVRAAGRGNRRMPSASEIAQQALDDAPTKQGYVRVFLEEMLRADAADVADELARHGAVVGVSATTRRARFEALLAAFDVPLRLRGQLADGSLAFDGSGATRELSELSASERRAVVIAATAVHVDLSRAIVLADGLGDTQDGDRWIEGLRATCPRGQLIVTTTRAGRWASGAAMLQTRSA
jgi:hypothetical protein